MPVAQETFEPDCFYHIYNWAVGKERLFFSEENYIFFLEKYKKYIHPIANTFSYCLMPNHFHFLIRVKSLNELKAMPQRGFQTLLRVETSNLVSKQFSHLFNSYVQAVNRQQHRTGSLLKNRFKRKSVYNDDYLRRLVVYIHLNPSGHGYCESFTGWKYSSYSALISKKPTQLSRDEVIDWFGDRENFLYCHQAKLELDSEYTLEED